jgi:hypothetical protein
MTTGKKSDKGGGNKVKPLTEAEKGQMRMIDLKKCYG